MKNTIDTILFNLDDTLIVEWKSVEESFTETISQIDSQSNIDDFLKTIREQAKEYWYKLPTIDFCMPTGNPLLCMLPREIIANMESSKVALNLLFLQKERN